MFTNSKSLKPNILRKTPPVKSQDSLTTTRNDSFVSSTIQSNNNKEVHGLESVTKDNIEHYEVIIDSKHNISLVLNKTQKTDNERQKPDKSSKNLCFLKQKNPVLGSVSGVQDIQFNLCNVVNVNNSVDSLEPCNGSQVEEVSSKIVISEDDILGNSIKPMKYKCNSCAKRFKSEKKFVKHVDSHNTDSSKNAKPSSFDCPAKKSKEGGEKDTCSRTFLIRDELLKHLNDEHSAEDALYKCGKCGRRFFWSLGLTGHARGGCGRGELRCGWAGCGRTFLQPCRLREHMRVHTGEKPYRCHYPGCHGVFRSASKLRRHVVRHTGERRHVCACSRAFTRADHLADHRATATCPAKLKSNSPTSETDPDEPFPLAPLELPQPESQLQLDVQTSMSSLESAISFKDEPVISSSNDACVQEFVFSGICKSESFSVDKKEEVESGGQSARTHCTWPLRPAPGLEPAADRQLYVLEEQIQAENVEENSNNIYTIRSDLFLHGNVLNNEDTEMIAPGPVNEQEVVISQPLDSELSLLDTHPTTDLMPEELMYTNVTIDDSLFRVFFLSEELPAPSPS